MQKAIAIRSNTRLAKSRLREWRVETLARQKERERMMETMARSFYEMRSFSVLMKKRRLLGEVKTQRRKMRAIE